MMARSEPFIYVIDEVQPDRLLSCFQVIPQTEHLRSHENYGLTVTRGFEAY